MMTTKSAERLNTGKPKLGYFARSFHKMLEGVARVMEHGAAKYGDDNWKKGGKPDEEYLDAMARHIDMFLQGEHHAQDSGCHHLAHAVWNLCALFELNYKDQPVIDEKIFWDKIKYWNQKRQEREDKLVSETKLAPKLKKYPVTCSQMTRGA